MKAFIVNRVGDLFFAIGIALVFLHLRLGRILDHLRHRSRNMKATPITCSARISAPTK